VGKLFAGRTFLVDCLLSELGWNWFCRIRSWGYWSSGQVGCDVLCRL